MSRLRIAGLLSAVALLASCGGETGSSGTAQLWITRDRGREVLLVREVKAGQTAMQALEREADVETRYGGRFVQSIERIEGSLGAQRDWFYFVNGIEGDRSAAEYRLRPGDVEWWDYRSWRGGGFRQRAVVGAFPEPFLHGYDGKRRPAAVRYSTPGQARAARAIARLIGATSVARAGVPVPDGANFFLLVTGPPRFTAELHGGATGRVVFTFSGDGLRLARTPSLYRYRYEVP